MVSRVLGLLGGLVSIVRNRIRSPGDVIRLSRTAFRIFRNAGLRGVAQVVRSGAGRSGHVGTDYASWIKEYDSYSAAQLQAMREAALALSLQPLISVIMPTYNTPINLLRKAINSVIGQTYTNWEFCIADDHSPNDEVRQVLSEFAKADRRIKLVFRDVNGHISNASNSAIDISQGEWLALLDHDDELAPDALFEVAKSINNSPNAKLIYSDEDKIDVWGERIGPYFKSDWNYHLFLSHNMITHLAVFRKSTVEAVGGFRSRYDGAQDYDLTLRVIEQCADGEIVHIPKILYHWRMLPGSTALASDEKPYAMLAGERALNEHLERAGIAGRAKLDGIGFKITYEIPKPAPLVSVIIPTKDRLDLLKLSVASVTEANDYENWEIIIVDNGSKFPETLNWLSEIQASDGRIRVIRDDGDFNYSRLNNSAAALASGEYLLLLNNDIEAISHGWLREMLSVCALDGVGAVGACLWYPDNTLQHGGVIMGLGGLAAHAHHGMARGLVGYSGRAVLRQEYSAVTGACLLTKKSTYLSLGGLDEALLKVAYNDVDYCLRLRQARLAVVWTPHAQLYHHESASRGYETSPEKIARFEGEKAVMLARWPTWIANDPAYNPNLSLSNGMFELAFPPRTASNA